jgi:hypothetical protein
MSEAIEINGMAEPRPARELLLYLASGTGFDPVMIWAAVAFLRQTGLDEPAAVAFATERALALWPEPETPNA